MLKSVSYRTYLIVVSICASLVLAACGDAFPTGPGTALTASVTSPSSSQPTGISATTAVSTTAASATVPVTTTSVTSVAATTAVQATTAPATTTAAITMAPSTTVANTTAPTTTSAATTGAPTTTGAATTATATTGAAAIDVTKVNATVKELDFLKQAGARNAYLSPDGSLIATTEAKSICIYTVAGQKQSCATPKSSIDGNSVVWSPDSRYLAYTENFVVFLHEPDVWLVEAASGKLIGLTEDNVDKFQINSTPASGKPATLDFLPVFTPDSRKLLFLRYTDQGQLTPQVLSIDIAGGQPTFIGQLDHSTGLANTFGYALSQDGKHLAYAYAATSRKDVGNGIWLGDATGRNSTQLISTPDLIASRPNSDLLYLVNAAFSADNNFVLGQGITDGATPARFNFDNVFIFGIDGKPVSAVDPANPVQWAAWSPTGSSLLTIVSDGTDNITKKVQKAGIYLLDKPGGTSVSLVDGNYYPPYRDARFRSSSWASNNTALFLRLSDQQMVLLQLNTK